ncbi:type II secretion system F family protein [candidate division KSB1 bacterium]
MKTSNLFSLDEWGRALVPERVRPHLHEYALKAGIKKVNYKLFGALFFISLFIAIILYFWIPKNPYIPWSAYTFLKQRSTDFLSTLFNLGLGSFVVLFVLMIIASAIGMFSIYFYVDLKIYSRTKEIEEILPEFLQYVASNLKGGMSFDRALWSAIKPRFGVLATEIEIAAKKVMTGEEVDQALMEFTNMYDSPMLKRTFNLIVEGMKGGGSIVYLIDKVIENINESQVLKKEMSASVTSYIIFISFIVIFVAPALFALSFQLLIIVSSFGEKLGGAGASDMPIQFGSGSIDPSDFGNFSLIAVGIIAAFSSMITSIIKRGDVKGGVKYIPVFLVLALLDYKIFMKILMAAFASLL